MNPEQWADVKVILGAAMDLPSGEREAYVAAACGGDSALRQEVDSLLAAADGDTDPPWLAPVQPTLRIGALLAEALGNRYEVLDLLGQGAMGAVYLAREHSLDRLVAIKVLRPELADAEVSRERFRREARVAAQLSHPSILPLHAFGEVHGVWYFVMGFGGRETLADRLRREGRLPHTEVRRILIELAGALECAHRHGVVHRDIKPSNVLLDAASGRAVLSDFGIASTAGSLESLTATGAVIGTPHYMSPEQALGRAVVDERSDIYSLGALGYTMLAGREPFSEAAAHELIGRKLAEDAPPIAGAGTSLPGDLVDAIMRALARDPGQRWESARQLKQALKRALRGVDEGVAEALHDLPSFGPYALLWAVTWVTIALMIPRSGGDLALLLLVAMLVPLGLVLHAWLVARQGLQPAAIVRTMFWPPEWWGMWWPRALRRPRDLWNRLPSAGRVSRVALSAFVVATPALVLTRQVLVSQGVLRGSAADPSWFVMAEVTLLVAAAAAICWGARWSLTQGLGWAESARMLFGPTLSSPAWRAPSIARLLKPQPVTAGLPACDEPESYHRAIGELLAQHPNFSTAAEAASREADGLLDEITRIDAEIVSLKREANDAEVDRLTARLTALGAARAGEHDDRAQLRSLVAQQLHVIHQMRARAGALGEERQRKCEALHELWSRVARAG